MNKIQAMIEEKKELVRSREEFTLSFSNKVKEITGFSDVKQAHLFNIVIELDKFSIGTHYTQLKSIYDDVPIYVFVADHNDDNTPVGPEDEEEVLTELRAWIEADANV